MLVPTYANLLLEMGSPPASSSMLARWKLFESSGSDAADSSGNGNDGTYQSTLPDRVPGPGGSIPFAQNFNGSSDFVLCPTFGSLSGPVTTTFWARSSVAANYRFGGNRDGSTNGLDHYVLNTGVIGSSSAAVNAETLGAEFAFDGTWQHIVIVRSAAGTKMYVNGVEVYDNGNTNAVVASAQPFRIGRHNPSAIQFFNGDMADWRLYDRVLTPTEITAVYDEGFAKLLSRTSIGLGIGL